MRFLVLPNESRIPDTGCAICYLWTDNWNDWFKYQTLYVLFYFDHAGEQHRVGEVKIGQFEMPHGRGRPQLPDSFDQLDSRFFSLGQDTSYYLTLEKLGATVKAQILGALNDIAGNEELLDRALEASVTGESLLRSVSVRTVKDQFRRIIAGGAELTPYDFRYTGPSLAKSGVSPLQLAFNVDPNSIPPTNIHVLIGRNGVGKTFVLNAMTRAIVTPGEDVEGDGEFLAVDPMWQSSAENPFANLLSISFSAFDDFQPVKERRDASKALPYSHIGLRARVLGKKGNWLTVTRNPSDLADEFAESAKACLIGSRSGRWHAALKTLETDPLFSEHQIAALADGESFRKQARQMFRKLSSGHKIVLLTITKLVEKVEEKTLVLMDEPEAHLHPPLLSAFIRALSDLLSSRNGVAIIATHSPVILQEVPSSCVWKIVRHGMASRADRPEIETFAENVGVLTREAFGLEVTRSGFHRMLEEAAVNGDTIESVLAKFNNQLGSEGRALASGFVAIRSEEG